ncbi:MULTISPECIES: hypothetical protein [Cryobacterium]|uniref:hypothetical protein n=1 Tax=Cryobacterium TaxID=69578 RepID=UPI000CD47526|nr:MULTISPECIES: hypothetical protein [Cryobacterium]POH69829.1 hypothetical protein C3B60_01500 [Cryobacterium zongtaii]TFC42847.1 hypothetical protein E3O57_13965 [Cryobacterium sp. TMN-39-2]
MALTAAGLTGCSSQGIAAEGWLGRSQIVDSTEMALTGCSLMCDPEVAGTIRESATPAQVRDLSEAATDYLSSHGGDEVGMTLTYGKVSFEIGGTRDETATLVDFALTAYSDSRVSSASAYGSGRQVWGPEADLVTMFQEYGGTEDFALSVLSDSGDDNHDTTFSLSTDSDRCDTSESLIAEFDRLLRDPAVTSLRLDLCTRLAVTVTDEPSVDPMVAQVQLLASNPEYSAIEFSVATEEGVPYSITAETPQMDAFFTVLDSTPGVASYSRTDWVLSVEVSDPALFRSVAAMIEATPLPSFISETLVSHAQVSVYLNGDGTLAAQFTTAESILASNAARAADHQISFGSRPHGTLDFKPMNYDEEAGRAIVDAVIAGGLWKTTSTKIAVLGDFVDFTVTADPGSNRLEVTKTNEAQETTRLIEELDGYWAAQTGLG